VSAYLHVGGVQEFLTFGFQLKSLHMSKDATYDANNNVFSLVYQMSITTAQGQEWVVNSKCYKVVDDNVLTHS
jgi:hypothetical protein